jgi:hypothetical protein
MQYLLMNQDTPWLLFAAQKNEFEGVECQELAWYSAAAGTEHFRHLTLFRGNGIW